MHESKIVVIEGRDKKSVIDCNTICTTAYIEPDLVDANPFSFMQSIDTTEITLNETEIKVYIADVSCFSDEKSFESAYLLIPQYRKEKINSYIFKKDKMLSLGVELLLHHAMLDFKVDPKMSTVALGDEGKPYLQNHRNFHYNLSHSGTKVMCVAGYVPVGCDVEKIQQVSMNFAEHCFFKSEIAAIRKQKEGLERDTIFCRLWTLKESFMKATGLGMKLPLDEFEILLENNHVRGIRQSVTSNQCTFSEIFKNDGYCYSVCCLSDDVI